MIVWKDLYYQILSLPLSMKLDIQAEKNKNNIWQIKHELHNYHIAYIPLHLYHTIYLIAFIIFNLSHYNYHIAIFTLHLSRCIYHIAFITLHSSHCIHHIAFIITHLFGHIRLKIILTMYGFNISFFFCIFRQHKPFLCSGSCDEIHPRTKLQNKTSLKDSWNYIETFYC